MILVEGRVFQLVWLIFFLGAVYVMIRRARAGLPIPEIRKIPGLEAIDEAIGRATEMGRPVHYSPGIGSISNPQTIASYAVLSYVARRCAEYDTRLIQTNRQITVHAVNQEIIKQAYLEAGRPDAYNPDDVRFLSTWQFGYTSGVLGIFQRERPAANILFGAFWAEAMILAETGHHVGAIQIGATANTAQIPFFVAGCDYALIGEEMYAASAYLSKEPVLSGTVVGQDIAKMVTFAFIILGFILEQVQGENNWLRVLFSK